ncbi:MAG: hypothetical protein RL376_284 [Verrucomicrobiota bacterium]|jgi:uncharacterized protein (TIGR02001 family)
MIKKTALVLAALVAGVSAQAQDAAGSSLSVTVDATYVSDYVFRGVQLADASLQPSIEAAYGDFYAGVWHSDSLKGGVGTETDLYAGYGIKLSDTFALDLGATRYVYESADAADSTEAFVGLKADVLLSPTLYYYHDFDYEISSYIASVGYSLPVEAIKSSLDFSASYGYIQRAGDDYSYGSVGVAVPYKLAENATLTVGADYIYNDTNTVAAFQNGKSALLVGKIGLAIGF